mmetsp:Transcript_21170/g.48062  ORF Transcript_21170/g.48062 Transcript_21170/m.48062 type:complete len:136 (+) Transcript_21170:524-931(+)
MRQERFLKECLATFKRKGRDWILLVDSDKHLIFNAVGAHKKRFSDADVELNSPATRPWRRAFLQAIRADLLWTEEATVRNLLNAGHFTPGVFPVRRIPTYGGNQQTVTSMRSRSAPMIPHLDKPTLIYTKPSYLP